jgi:MFS transporter, ACS family, D-galactonate transporter
LKNPAENKKDDRRVPGHLWAPIVLMVISIIINYLDRGSLSTAAPLLKTDMSLSPAQIGILLSAFFWSYALMQIISGWLVDRYNVIWVMAVGFFVWSVAIAATGMANTFGTLLLLRMLLGTGESVAYPSYSKILAANYAEHQRGLANALIDAGSKVGPAFGTLVGGILMAEYGWRPFFIFLGLISLLWIPAWVKWMPRGNYRVLDNEEKGPGFKEILSKKQLWATMSGHFCGNYFWYFLLTWLPFYLVRERGFSMEKMAVIGALAYSVTAVATTFAGWISDRSIAAGISPTRVRKTCTITGLSFATVVLAVVVIPGSFTSMAFLMLACFAYGIFASSHWAITQTIAGPKAAGKWSGLQNCFANFAGVIAPAVTGFVVNITDHFFWAFAVSSIVALTGAAVYAFFLGSVKPVIWESVPSDK